MSTREVSSPPTFSLLIGHRRSFARLPVALTPLVGREQELGLARNLLRREDVRLLSITGPGGIGKTRLAVELCRAEVDAYPDGVVFVPLAAVSGPGRVATAVQQALGIQEEVGADARESLIAALQGAASLLVLDNFEHVLEAAPLLTDLLAACAELKIVVTSRALLRLTGEYALPVPPLLLPDPEGAHSLEQVGNTPSVRLFVDRVQATNPTFSLSDETAPLVAGICRHLDGLPLAIELAAAQAAILPPAALLNRIKAHLPLPVMGPRDAPARLRTITDAVAWSHALLTDDEKRLFRRISVFAGGFAFDAAEQMAGTAAASERDHATPATTTLEGLSALVEKSLLLQELRDHEPRFVMLETIRAFAWDQLVASGEVELIGDAHAAWVLGLAEQHEFAMVMPDGERDLQRLEADHPNLLVALTWFERRGNDRGLLRLASSLGGFWIAHNHYREGRDWLERALARTTDDTSAVRGRAEIGLGRAISQFGDVERADRLLSDGIAKLDRERDAAWTSFALTRQASLANQLGEHDRAVRLLNQALEVATAVSDAAIAASITGTILANLGVAAHGRGDFDLAIARHEQALRICRERGYTLGAIRSLRDLGDIDRDRGEYARSLAYYRGAVDLLGDQADLRVIVDALEGAALAAAAWRQPALAARLLGAAGKFRTQHGGEFLVPTDRTAHDRAEAAIRSALSEAEVEAAWSAGRQLTVAEAIAEIQAMMPVDGASEKAPPSAVSLTSREIDVLRLIVAGLPDRAIADALFLSVRTVEAHVARILTKLEVHTRTAAASRAIAAGLVDPALGHDRPHS